VEVTAQVIEDYRTAPIDEKLRATLGFLEKVTLTHEQVRPEDARVPLALGVSREALVEALDVLFVFNVMDRLADTMGWELQRPEDLRRLAPVLLERGYGG